MAINIVTAIQDRMGFSPFDKTDPNEEQGRSEFKEKNTADHYAQAASIAVLVGFYQYAQSTQGANELLSGSTDGLLPKIFAGKDQEVVNSVADYGFEPYDRTRLFMQKIAEESLAIIRDQQGKDNKTETLKDFITSQRHNILVYLPPSLRIGKIIKNEQLEDRTNKM